ncbi:MAG: hypothetical protein AAGG81_05685, partial [Chlamydiota bacterium]
LKEEEADNTLSSLIEKLSKESAVPQELAEDIANNFWICSSEKAKSLSEKLSENQSQTIFNKIIEIELQRDEHMSIEQVNKLIFIFPAFFQKEPVQVSDLKEKKPSEFLADKVVEQYIKQGSDVVPNIFLDNCSNEVRKEYDSHKMEGGGYASQPEDDFVLPPDSDVENY